MLENIFEPVFEATLNPEANPNLSKFLENISGFDTVDDESKSSNPIDRTFSSKDRTPKEWDITDNPSYKYYSYFIQSNVRILNQLRHMRGLNTFSYRPHAGEAGEVHHLDTAFLLADGINHGLNLRKSPSLQYLFYLARIGLAMSPCSNNQLFLAYEKSPFPVFFARGLNVSLSTDDPLMFHQTKEPLMEEYSIAKQLWHFSSVDMCEIARNSVLQSGFPDAVKASWLGSNYFYDENDKRTTNVPSLRFAFRKQVYNEEMALLRGQVGHDQVADLCNLLLLSPKSRAVNGHTNGHKDHEPLQKKMSVLTLPRVATLPIEVHEIHNIQSAKAEREDVETEGTSPEWRPGKLLAAASVRKGSFNDRDTGLGQGTLGGILEANIHRVMSHQSFPGSASAKEDVHDSFKEELRQLVESSKSQMWIALGAAALAGSCAGAAVAVWAVTRRR